MPTYFASLSNLSGGPIMFVAQGELEDVLAKLRKYSVANAKYCHVYELRTIPEHPQFNPEGCKQLAMVGVIRPEDEFDHYLAMFAMSVKDLPAEQRDLHIEKALGILESHKSPKVRE